jgi:hypothetical protein
MDHRTFCTVYHERQDGTEISYVPFQMRTPAVSDNLKEYDILCSECSMPPWRSHLLPSSLAGGRVVRRLITKEGGGI